MPAILERLISQLQKKGVGKSQAFATATSQLQKHGILKHGSEELTKKGEKRNAMTPAGRARDRAAKASGRKASDYSYDSRTNRATLKR